MDELWVVCAFICRKRSCAVVGNMVESKQEQTSRMKSARWYRGNRVTIWNYRWFEFLINRKVDDFIGIKFSVCNLLRDFLIFFVLTKHPDSFSTEQFSVGRNQEYVLTTTNNFTRWAHIRFIRKNRVFAWGCLFNDRNQCFLEGIQQCSSIKRSRLIFSLNPVIPTAYTGQSW